MHTTHSAHESQMLLRPAAQRGVAELGWLSSRHTFSFGEYFDPQFMGFGSLRVINDDRVLPGQGFGTHPHRDMEILSVVVEGALEHRDSLGNGSTIVPGEVQLMSAGTGITHSEFNPSSTDELRFLQVWIRPDRNSLVPGYGQRRFPFAERRNELLLVASADGRDASLTIHQDVAVYRGYLGRGAQVDHGLGAGRRAWLQVIDGAVLLDGQRLESGDGVGLSEAHRLSLVGETDHNDVLLFDLA